MILFVLLPRISSLVNLLISTETPSKGKLRNVGFSYLLTTDRNEFVSGPLDFSMPGTFQMVPLRMFIVDKDALKTYFFKVIDSQPISIVILSY